MAENAYTKLPKNQRYIVGVVIAIVVAVAFKYGWYDDNATIRDGLVADLGKLNAEIAELNVVKAQMPALEKEVDQLSLRLDQLRRILPPAKETPDLMKRLQALASQSNLKIKMFTPGQTVQKEFYLEWPIEIQVDGTYPNLAAFFDRVGRLPRIVNIGNIRTSTAAKQTFNQTLSAQYTAMTYVYSEPAPKPAVRR
ncbi:MAG: type 4a pilus biogenesis protein PilO [Vicinamibacteria bacterium]